MGQNGTRATKIAATFFKNSIHYLIFSKNSGDDTPCVKRERRQLCAFLFFLSFFFIYQSKKMVVVKICKGMG